MQTMNTFKIISLGCKVNQYESQQIRELLESFCLRQVEDNASPDLAIVHTCCVTHTAASKSRQLMRKILKHNSLCKVIATGCLTSIDTDECNNIPDEIKLVSREESLEDIIRQVIDDAATTLSNSTENTHDALTSKTANECKIKDKKTVNSTQDTLNLGALKSFENHSRAFLKIQDGCDAFCTYCIIPKTRKKLWSNSPKNVISEAKQLVKAGHKEIVLTGIFLGAFGQTTTKRKNWDSSRQKDFVKLIENIAQIDGLKRLRLSSMEPGDVTEELLGLFNRYDNIAPHLHLPLQAGSSKTLRRMNRQYNAKQYIEMIEMVNEALDRPAISTDIIVGFPGESDEDFEESLKIAKFAKFAKTHVFSFSVRKGTAAEKMPDKISPEIIKCRSKILSSLGDELQVNFRNQFASEKLSVIVENSQYQSGVCERYFDVKLTDSNLKRGEFTEAILSDDCIHAKII